MGKYTCYFKLKIYSNIWQTWPNSLLYIQQRRIHNPIKPLSKEVTTFELTVVTKSSILDVWQDSEYATVQQTIKTIKTYKAKTNHVTIIRQAT